MGNNTEQMYMRYIKNRKANSNSAIGLHTSTREEDTMNNYMESHNRILENMNQAREIEKELAERVLKLLEE